MKNVTPMSAKKTSTIDPTAAENVLAAITRLVHDLGVTVLMAEHRLKRVVQYADRIVHLPGEGVVRDGPPAEILADWKTWLPKFRKVIPVEYRRALKEMKANADAEPKIAIGA